MSVWKEPDDEPKRTYPNSRLHRAWKGIYGVGLPIEPVHAGHATNNSYSRSESLRSEEYPRDRDRQEGQSAGQKRVGSKSLSRKSKSG